MSGETEASVSGWTVDTLHSHVITQFEMLNNTQETRVKLLQDELDRRLANMQKAIDDRRADLRDNLMTQLNGLREMLNERYATQTKALDAAFIAQQTAMKTAFDAADKAVAAALESAEKAVVKAETAAEKRFESVNEFRAQLTDQAATFLSRNEYNTTHKALTEKMETGLEVLTTRLTDETRRSEVQRNDLELRLTSRLDLSQGASAGSEQHRANSRLDMQVILPALALLVSIISVAYILIHH
jgi:hypothetical protein